MYPALKKFALLCSLFALSLNLISQNSASTLTCTNWLSTPAVGSAINLGDLDIPGNQITVEAIINRTTPYSGGNLYAGDVVSKHESPTDVNYLLRPNSAEITTTNGYFSTPPICSIDLNKTYHIALVYNGSVLKFYRNGYLMSQVNASGNLFQNNFNARIGYYASQFVNTQFIGYINEVRIWNVARTQTEIQTYMNSSLPSPTTQTGLQAYYTFDNLINKQGNATFNGTINGAAAINSTNPICSLASDSCGITSATGISSIINQYTPVLALDPCKNILTVGDALNYNIGDTVLLIQMKGAVIDSTNTATFGTITNYKNAGNYEFNFVKSKSGNTIELKNTLTRNYDLPDGKVQLVRVPYYQNADITSTLTCPAWNGSTGGILVLNVANEVTLHANIDVNGKGFRGGAGFNNGLGSTSNCFQNNYIYPSGSMYSGNKGESIVSISNNITGGKGALDSGGGAGLDHNGGGGGGANGGTGGFGGYQLMECGNSPFDNRGIGGKILTYNTATNKIFMGGGGGSGHANNTGTVPAGGNGGGIIMINAAKITNTAAYKIITNGDSANICTPNPGGGITCHDGMGGGGAGGTVLINTNQLTNSITTEQKGGKGADMNGPVAGGTIGPGGGGGGGVLWVNAASLPANLTNVSSGGLHGVITETGNAWGTTDGQNGINVFNLQIPVDAIPFKINIDSVRFNFAATTCSNVSFNGLAYINTTPVATWQWNFGDGNNATGQNVSHTYSTTGTFTVKLIITDNNGCKDSISRPVVVTGLAAFDFTYKQDVCNPLSVQFTGAGTSLTSPYWTFGDAGINAGNIAPTHTYAVPGNYLVRFTISNPGCNDTISKLISINTIQSDIVITPDTTICFGVSKQLRARHLQVFAGHLLHI
jgi:PKD repeat protein